MTNLHPTMASALEPFYQAIGAINPATDPAPKPSAPSTPPAPKHPVERHYWTVKGQRLPDLAIDVIFYPRSYGRRDEWGQLTDPDDPAGCEIQAVWLGHYDIFPLMSEELLSEIESDFMAGREC